MARKSPLTWQAAGVARLHDPDSIGKVWNRSSLTHVSNFKSSSPPYYGTLNQAEPSLAIWDNLLTDKIAFSIERPHYRYEDVTMGRGIPVIQFKSRIILVTVIPLSDNVSPTTRIFTSKNLAP